MAIVNITINGRKISVESGSAILKVASDAGIYIPTLCDHPALSPIGACRMCIVEIKGQRTLQTACTFPIADGMEINTESESVKKARKLVLEMIFSERNHFCPYCEMSGSCELQDLGYKYKIDHWPFPTYLKAYPVDSTHKHYVMDHNRCILCERCYRACDELVANHTLGLRQRGSGAMIHADGNLALGESSCVSCGTCVQVCPTGALSLKRSAFMGKTDLTEKIKSTCEKCSVGCGTEIIVRGGNVLHINGDWDADVNKGILCKAGRFDPLYEKRERITSPMIRENGKLKETTWENALKALVDKINNVKADGIGVLAGTSISNEALFLLDKFFRQNLKVSNIGFLAEKAPKAFSGKEAKLEDIPESDVIIVTGVDPVKDQQVASFLIKRAVDKGARLIIADEKENGLAPFAYMTFSMAEIGKAVEIAQRANNPLVIYGSGITKKSADELKKLDSKAKFIIIEPGVNSRAADAFGINGGFDPAKTKLLFAIMGESAGYADQLQKISDKSFVAVQSSYVSELTGRADLVLPAVIWSERSGSLTNTEGRVGIINKAVEPAGEALNDWEAVQMLAKISGKNINISKDEVIKKILNN